ncbi:MAG: hypothetical protein ABIJ82_04095 [Patescibacteria group bacterium]|nr:hypothetical protein [Patescibacteria group bacterium]MBU1952643.1 hypothetical protein [Patescibacteria group bacterium]
MINLWIKKERTNNVDNQVYLSTTISTAFGVLSTLKKPYSANKKIVRKDLFVRTRGNKVINKIK